MHSACVRMHLGDLDGAQRQFRQAIEEEPKRIAGRLMLADCLVRQGALAEARSLLEAVLAQEPGHTAALDRRNTLLLRQGDWPALRLDLERQVRRYTGPEAAFVRSHVDLLFGDMLPGWRGFEARLDIPGRPVRNFAQPRWQGQPFPGQTLLLTWEQGFGDTLMFLRFAPLAKALGGRVLVEVQPQLTDLAATCQGIDEVISAGQELPPFDLHASLLSLPAVLCTDLANLPAAVHYLAVPGLVPERQRLAELLDASRDRVRIGVCWAGSSQHPKDGQRSLAARQLAPLAVVPEVAWHSFQYLASEEAPLPGMVSFGALLQGFENTAFALSHMDLVITVDTVLAHLAGALGIPALVLLSSLPDFRWMLGREDSPWYPTLRLYRQAEPGDWQGVLEQVVADLTNPG